MKQGAEGEHVLYDVPDFKDAVVIELKDEWFSRLIVEVPKPDEPLRIMPKLVVSAA